MSELKYNFGSIDGAASGSSDYAGSHSLYQDVFIPSANADSTQSGDDINIGVGELQECTVSKSNDGNVDSFATTGDTGATAAQAGAGMQSIETQVGGMFCSTGDVGTDGRDGSKGGNVEFEWKVEEGESSGDVLDLRAIEAADAGKESGLTPQVFTVTLSNPTNDDAFDFKAMEESEGVGKPNPGKMNFEHYFDRSSAFDGDGADDLATYQPDADGGFVYLYYTTTPASDFDGSLATVDVLGIPATMAEYGLLLA
jgi:hypothetical protein